MNYGVWSNSPCFKEEEAALEKFQQSLLEPVDNSALGDTKEDA